MLPDYLRLSEQVLNTLHLSSRYHQCLCFPHHISMLALFICICVRLPVALPSYMSSHQSMKATLRFHCKLWCNRLETLETIHTHTHHVVKSATFISSISMHSQE